MLIVPNRKSCGRETAKKREDLVWPQIYHVLLMCFWLLLSTFSKRRYTVLNYKVCLVCLSRLLGEWDCREPRTVLCPQRLSGVVSGISYIIYYPYKRHRKGSADLVMVKTFAPGEPFHISKLVSLPLK